MTELSILENRISKIEDRNKKVEKDKAFKNLWLKYLYKNTK